MRFPILWRSVMLEQKSSREVLLIFQPHPGLQWGHLQTQLPHYNQEEKNREMCVKLSWFQLNRAARRAACSDGLSLSLCWQIRDRDKEAESWKPTRVFLIPSFWELGKLMWMLPSFLNRFFKTFWLRKMISEDFHCRKNLFFPFVHDTFIMHFNKILCLIVLRVRWCDLGDTIFVLSQTWCCTRSS